jgi:hypothetical protein
MRDSSKDKVYDWWCDNEFNEYCALIETNEGKLILSITPKPKAEEQ